MIKNSVMNIVQRIKFHTTFSTLMKLHAASTRVMDVTAESWGCSSRSCRSPVREPALRSAATLTCFARRANGNGFCQLGFARSCNPGNLVRQNYW